MKTFLLTTNSIFAKIASLVLVSSMTLTAWGAGEVTPTKADIQSAVEKTVYSLENVQNGYVAKDIMQLEGAAGGGMSISVAAEIAVRMKTAMDLLVYIAKDKTLTQQEKRPMINDLGSAVGKVYLVVIRHHGDDELNPQLDESSPIAKFSRRALQEFGRTFTDVIRKDASANNEEVRRILDRMIRDMLGQMTTIEFQKVVASMGDIPGERADDAIRLMLWTPEEGDPYQDGVAEKALRIRESRRSGHLAVYGLLGALAATWTFVPWATFDYVGLVVGRDYSDATASLTNYITYGTLGAIATLKQATGAFRTIPGLKKLIEMTKDPAAAAADPKFSKLKLPLWARVLRLPSKLEKQMQKVQCKIVVNIPGIGNTNANSTVEKP